MDQLHKDILGQMRNKLIDDIDIYNGILPTLINKYVLRNQDVSKIKMRQTKQDRAQALLDVLPGCGPYAFNVFHESLKKHYIWLSDDIDAILSTKPLPALDVKRSASPGAPNLPPQPFLHVVRQEKLKHLNQELKNLVPGGYLVLHGMKGYGKSCLTRDALNDSALVKSLFDNKVYWIKFGYERLIDDEIMVQLNFLYHQVISDPLMANIYVEPLKEQLIPSLKSHFGQEENRESLLILDDVWSEHIIEAFDFPCKTLVITTDSGLLNGKLPHIIQIMKGFSQAESLGLFAQVLEVNVANLPPQAKQIHEECTGMPILIAMFAAQFGEHKEDMRSNADRWKYYLQSLRKKDSSNPVLGRCLAKQEATFEVCINKLKPDLKSKFEALAIFSEAVNIMPETLAILWGGEKYSVEDQMVELCHKSLVAKDWNLHLKSFIYGVHDLLLCYLRKKLGKERLKEMHKSFVESLRRYSGGDFSKLPNDNYSFSYIGHHLEQAEMYEEFPKLYLNFDFIREKINHTCLSDLFIDLRKYRKCLVQGKPEIEEKVEDLVEFLESHAGIITLHRQRKCLDLVQIGLNCTTKSFVYEKSRELANAQPSKVFVVHDNTTFTLSVSDEIPTEGKTAFFTKDPDKILISNNSGEVILWNCKTRSKTVFEGPDKNSTVHKIIVSDFDDYFITLCDSGRILYFDIHDDENHSFMHSPREKQAHWNHLFGNKSCENDAKFCIDGETITDIALTQTDENVSYIAACTDAGTFQIWSIDQKIICTDRQPKCAYVRIFFSGHGSMLHLISSDGVLTFYSKQGNDMEYTYASIFNPKLEEEKIIYAQALPPKEGSPNEGSLIVVTEMTAVRVKWHQYRDLTKNHISQIDRQIRVDPESPDIRFTSSALTNDGQYLIIADTNDLIKVWNVVTSFEPIATFNGRVLSLDTYRDHTEFHLILGCGKNIFYRWQLALEDLPQSVRKPLYDARMEPWGTPNIIAKEVQLGANSITVNLYKGDEFLRKTGPIKDSIVRLSLNSTGDEVLYATDKGVVTLYDMKTNSSKAIMKLTAPPNIAKFMSIGDSSCIICSENDTLRIAMGKVSAVVADTGHVISIHTINEKFVMTVARNGCIQFFHVRQTNWRLAHVIQACTDNESIVACDLNAQKNLLVIFKSNCQIFLMYEIILNEEEEPKTSQELIQNEPRTPPEFLTPMKEFAFKHKCVCCKFSNDDNYLSIAVENGDILICDLKRQYEMNRLELHCNDVRELHWAPTSIGAPILLSVNCDELAWWNVAFSKEDKKITQRNRMGMARSASNFDFSPRSSFKMSTSFSCSSDMASAIANRSENLTVQSIDGNLISYSNGTKSNGHDTSGNYWKGKTAKNANRRALLTMVPLPPSCNSKICVSDDFSKFISINIHGIVSNFQFYNYEA